MKSPLLRSPSNAADHVLDMRDSPMAKYRRNESKGTLARFLSTLVVLLSVGLAVCALFAAKNLRESNGVLELHSRELQSTVSSVKGEQEKLRAKVNELTAALGASDRAMKGSAQALEKMKESKAGMERDLEDRRQRVIELDAVAQNHIAAIASLKEEKAELAKQAEDARQRLKECQAQSQQAAPSPSASADEAVQPGDKKALEAGEEEDAPSPVESSSAKDEEAAPAPVDRSSAKEEEEEEEEEAGTDLAVSRRQEAEEGDLKEYEIDDYEADDDDGTGGEAAMVDDEDAQAGDAPGNAQQEDDVIYDYGG